MLARRKQLLDDIMSRIQLGQTLGSQRDADAVANFHQSNGQNQDGTPTQFQEVNRPPSHEELNELIGAANFWKIPNPEKIPPAALKKIIEAQRMATVGDDNPNSYLTQVGASMGLGITQDLLKMAQHIPFIGNAVAENAVVQQSSQWLHMLNESVQQGMTPGERKGYRIAHGLGGMLGYVLPGEAAWKAAGAVGKLGALTTAGSLGKFITNPLGRAAIRGGASAWLLEGGGDQSNEEAAIKVAVGAGAGVVFGELLPRIFEKIKQAFPSKSDVFADFTPADRRASATRDNTVDAEWYFEADHQLAGNRPQLGEGNGGQPANTPGGPPPAAARLAGQGQGPTEVETLDPTFRTSEPPTYEPGPPQQLMTPEKAAMTERILGLEASHDHVQRALNTDQLTGLGNKAALTRAIPHVDGDPELGWAVFDGKGFKAVNDTHGHEVGDLALQNFGRAIQQAAAEMQIPIRAFRQGGDEFAAVVPKENLQAFTQRVGELSYQRIGGVETKLDGYAADQFTEADLTLMQNKRSTKFAAGMGPSEITEGNIPTREFSATSYEDITRAPRDTQILVSPNTIPGEGPWRVSRIRNGEPLEHFDMPDQEAAQRYAAALSTPGTTPMSLADPFYYQRPGSTEDAAEVGRYIAETGRVPTLGVVEAGTEGAQLTKQAQLINSEYLPEVMGASEITEADVARTLVGSYPGRIHVVRGVGNPEQVVRALADAQAQGVYTPGQIRLVDRNGQIDMLTSGGLRINERRVKQYQRHGFFEGMANESGLIVKNVPREVGGLATLLDPVTGQTHHVPAEQVMPGNHAPPEEQYGAKASQLYNDFRAYAESYMAAEAEKLPPGHSVDTSWLSPETSSQLPRLLDAFESSHPAAAGIGDLEFESIVGNHRAQDFQALAPDEIAETYRINRELDQARTVRPIEKMPIEDIAATKGFAFLVDNGAESGLLVDQLSDLRVPVENEDAAYEFLRNFVRDVPDYTPVSDVPVEAFGVSPHAANPGIELDPVSERGAEFEIGAADRATADIEAIISAVESGQGDLLRFEPALTQPPGGGGFPPGGPPPRGASLGGGGQNALPPGPRSLGAQFAEVARQRPQDLYRVLQNFDSAWLRYLTPFRNVTIKLERSLKDIGITEGTLWKHYSQVTTDVTRAHNEALPWQAEYADIMSNFRRRLLRTGEVTRIQELVGYNRQIEAMQRAGYKPAEISAQKRLADFNDRFFRYLADDPAYNIDDSRYIAGYMSHVRQRQGMPGIQDPFKGGEDILPHHLRFFAEMAREGNMQFRQMDARVLGVKMIRAAMFKKNVSDSWNEMATAWDDPRIPQEFRDLTKDWLEVVRTGHNPNYDAAIQGTRHTLNAVGIPVTSGEVATLSNIAFGNMYRAQLGGRPDAWFRDSVQPLLAGARIGFKPLAKAYDTLLTGGQVTRDMVERGMRGGWLEKGQAKVANADVFEQGIQTPEGVELLTERQQARRELFAKIGDMAWAATPRRLRNGLQGTPLDPLFYYTKLGEVNRLVSGEAGYQLAADAIAEYQYAMQQALHGTFEAGAPTQVDAMDQAMAQLMKASKARVYPKPIQDEFQRLITNGQVQEAADLLGNESANSQFRYGAKENPIGIRKAGNIGRAVMQFGSFTTQYVALMKEMALDPAIPVAEKMAMGARYAAITGALGWATAITGWNFSKWMWHQSLTFAGGPAAQGLWNALQVGTGLAAQAMGAPMSPSQFKAVEDFSRTKASDVLMGIAGQVFPYTSTIRTIENIDTMAHGVNPVEGTARTIITGETSLKSDWQQLQDRRDEELMNQIRANGGRPPIPPSNIAGAGAQ